MTPPPCKPIPQGTLAMLGAGWVLIALFLGETRLLATLPGPAPQVTVWTITALLLVSILRNAPLREWVMHLPIEALIAVHLTRFVGVYFLWLHTRGQLPASFAIPAGWGDIAAAATAGILLLVRNVEAKRGWLLLWNTLALADILMVLSSGIRISSADRFAVMDQLTQLPLSFLPTLIVPLILATHVLIYCRIWKHTNPRRNSNFESPAGVGLRRSPAN